MIDGQLLLKKNNEQKRIFFFFKVADFYPETGCQLIELFIWWGSQNERQTARNKKNVSTTAQPYIYAHLHACVWNPAPGVALAVPNNEVSSTNSLLPVWRYRFNPIAATRICPSDFALLRWDMGYPRRKKFDWNCSSGKTLAWDYFSVRHRVAYRVGPRHVELSNP